MPFDYNRVEFRVTDTQKTIAAAALRAVSNEWVDEQDPMIQTFARMMVVIQGGGLQSYFHRGLQWSLRSRNQRDWLQVEQEGRCLEDTIAVFSEVLEMAYGEGARRIRANRARRQRELELAEGQAAEWWEAARELQRARQRLERLEPELERAELVQ